MFTIDVGDDYAIIFNIINITFGVVAIYVVIIANCVVASGTGTGIIANAKAETAC